LQPDKTETKSGLLIEESGFKIIKNKVCKFRKGFYLCNPKTREKKSETVLEKGVKVESESQRKKD
jgi:hypothetical protein